MRLRVTQSLGYPRGSGLPSVTGVVVLPDPQGRFRVVIRDAGQCTPLKAHARSATQHTPAVINRARCMETRQPVVPVERFRVTDGQYVHAIYVRRGKHRRYSEKLGPDRTWGRRPLRRHQAIEIARARAGAAKSARVFVRHGQIPVGLAGLWTSVWQVWVSGVRVPGYGRGDLVVLVVRSHQGGATFETKGRILDAWFAP